MKISIKLQKQLQFPSIRGKMLGKKCKIDSVDGTTSCLHSHSFTYITFSCPHMAEYVSSNQMPNSELIFLSEVSTARTLNMKIVCSRYIHLHLSHCLSAYMLSAQHENKEQEKHYYFFSLNIYTLNWYLKALTDISWLVYCVDLTSPCELRRGL